MNIVESVEISGFWGTKHLKVRFHPDVNFFIGPNGSGKTTVINLIAAALNGDITTLNRIQFDSIEVMLRTVQSRRRPSIVVIKSESPQKPFPSITYKIKDRASGNSTTYPLEDLGEFLSAKEFQYAYYRDYHVEGRRRITHGVRERLREVVNVSWLSVHRSAALTRAPEDRNYASAVDKKIHDLSNDLVRYLSLLARDVSREVQRFQEFIFLSLLIEQRQQDAFAFGSASELDEQRNALIDIFRQFGLPEKGFLSKVNNYFDSAQKAFGKDRRRSLTGNDLAFILNTHRLNSVIEEWRKLLSRRIRFSKL